MTIPPIDDYSSLEIRIAALERESHERQLLEHDAPTIIKKITTQFEQFQSHVNQKWALLQVELDSKWSQSLVNQGIAKKEGDVITLDVEGCNKAIGALKYQIKEVNGLLLSCQDDMENTKRMAQSCEREMDDFTGAMDAMNVDLDEMRAKVDATHSIITSRQRVEATVTADISSIRLDLGDIQDTLKSHDEWMENVSTSIEDAHERLNEERRKTEVESAQIGTKLGLKVDISQWNESNEEIDMGTKVVRDMATALRTEIDEKVKNIDEQQSMITKKMSDCKTQSDTTLEQLSQSLTKESQKSDQYFEILQNALNEHRAWKEKRGPEIDEIRDRLTKEIQFLAETDHKNAKIATDTVHQHFKRLTECFDAMQCKMTNDGVEIGKKMESTDLKMSALQGVSGEIKRDILKIREESNDFKVTLASLDVDMNRIDNELKRFEQHQMEEEPKLRREIESIIEELDSKGEEKTQQLLEENVANLAKGVVKIAQVLGVFPSTRLEEGTEEELELNLDTLHWEDICQNIVTRIDKTWKHVAASKFRSVLDLVSKKADHSVLRLLQISQQAIETQIDRVRQERELWKEEINKRQQQPVQLSVTAPDPLMPQLYVNEDMTKGGAQQPVHLSFSVKEPHTGQMRPLSALPACVPNGTPMVNSAGVPVNYPVPINAVVNGTMEYLQTRGPRQSSHDHMKHVAGRQLYIAPPTTTRKERPKTAPSPLWNRLPRH